MKQKDVITGWLVAFIISCMMLAGCTEKARKLEKKNVKVETISVGNTNLGERKTMWEPSRKRWDLHSASR